MRVVMNNFVASRYKHINPKIDNNNNINIYLTLIVYRISSVTTIFLKVYFHVEESM